MSSQLNHIEQKTNFQCIKLWPVLRTISLEERINLWTVLVRPLFEMLIFLYYTEKGKCNLERVHLKIRKTFKKYCLLKKNIDDKTIQRLIDFQFEDRVDEVVKITQKKWEARENNDMFKKPIKIEPKTNQAIYPRELQELLNLKTAMCTECNTRCNSIHLREVHNIIVPENTQLLDKIETDTKELKMERMTKKEILEELGKRLQPHINNIKIILNE